MPFRLMVAVNFIANLFAGATNIIFMSGRCAQQWEYVRFKCLHHRIKSRVDFGVFPQFMSKKRCHITDGKHDEITP
jgi:hypothetical protein